MRIILFILLIISSCQQQKLAKEAVGLQGIHADFYNQLLKERAIVRACDIPKDVKIDKLKNIDYFNKVDSSFLAVQLSPQNIVFFKQFWSKNATPVLYKTRDQTDHTNDYFYISIPLINQDSSLIYLEINYYAGVLNSYKEKCIYQKKENQWSLLNTIYRMNY